MMLRRFSWLSLALACIGTLSGATCNTGGPNPFPPNERPILGNIDPTVFQKDFMWGASVSAHQCEGNDDHADWAHWISPVPTSAGVPAGQAADHYNRFAQDLDLLKAINLNTYRFSVSWARLYPHPDMAEPDPDAVAHYDAVLAACKARGIRPMLTLHHFVMPDWLTEQDRWGDGRAIDDFKKLTRFAADRWGKDVDYWITVNEPEVFAFHGWLRAVFPPGKTDFALALRVLANLMKAHAEAYHIIKESDTIDADGDGQASMVGIAHLVVPVVPYTPWNPFEQFVATAVGAFTNSFWFVADRTGIIDLRLPFGPELIEDFPLFRGTHDFIGINYYSRQIIRIDPLLGVVVDQYPNSVRSSLGIEVYPQGLYDSMQFMSQFGLPLLITENGIADSDDSLRPAYIKSHLAEISRFMRDRPDVSVKGYIHWALMDNFEWEHGFGPRFGLYAVDYATQQRTARPSALLFSEIIAAINAATSDAGN